MKTNGLVDQTGLTFSHFLLVLELTCKASDAMRIWLDKRPLVRNEPVLRNYSVIGVWLSVSNANQKRSERME